MNGRSTINRIAFIVAIATMLSSPAHAHKLREKGTRTTVASSTMSVAPPRDWNRLGINPGKRAETWTLNGPQLDDLTFYAGVEPGEPLVKERNKKRDPLPKFTSSTLVVEVPELLEGTYRTYKDIGAFQVTSTKSAEFLGHSGALFTYEYTDQDQLTRKGEANAAIIDGKLYMATFDAPRLFYFDKLIADVRALIITAKI